MWGSPSVNTPALVQTKARVQSKSHLTHPSQGALALVTEIPKPPQPLLLCTSILKRRFLHGPLRAHKLRHCMQHCEGLCIFLGSVYLDFHWIPGGINDLKRLREPIVLEGRGLKMIGQGLDIPATLGFPAMAIPLFLIP